MSSFCYFFQAKAVQMNSIPAVKLLPRHPEEILNSYVKIIDIAIQKKEDSN